MTNETFPLPQRWPSAGVGSRQFPAPRREAAIKRFFAAIGFILDSTRRRRSGRFVLWSLVLALAGAGVWMLAYPLVTDLWADRIQNNLEGEFATIDPNGYGQGTFKEGQALTRLLIPKLKVDVIVVEGWSGNALRAGAGHKPDTPLPGDPGGNVAIAGHRTGFGEPFRHLDKLKSGDEVILVTPVGRFTYSVVDPFDGHANPWITTPTDLGVIGATPYGALTLVTCDPPHTSKNRMIVRLKLLTGAGTSPSPSV